MKLSRTDYYQGILQLREVNNEIIDFAYAQIQKRDNVAVTRIVKYPNGIDMYITSQKFIRILGKKMKEIFGGELKTSSQLHTRSKHGKDLFRVNVLFRLQKHKVGDIISIRGNRVRLLHIGSKIFARDMKTGKKVTIRISDLPKN